MTDAPLLSALIVDDEPLGRDTVRLALAEAPDVRVVGECGSGREAVARILADRPDVVFLDVQMPGGDGFSVVEALPDDVRPVIVFVTAYDAHALRAFDAHAVDYLLKPFDGARFARALDRVRAQLRARDLVDVSARLAALLRTVRGAPADEALPAAVDPAAGGAAHHRTCLTRIAVRTDDRTTFIAVAGVDWFEADGNYVWLHVGAQRHRVRATIRELAAQLDPGQFRRVHRSGIVNIARVREVQPWFGGDYVAILHDGAQVRVSRTYAAALLRPLQ